MYDGPIRNQGANFNRDVWPAPQFFTIYVAANLLYTT